MAQSDPLFGAAAPALRVHGQRLGVIAGNIANADTPGFKARDVNFREVLQGVGDSSLPMARSHAGHVGDANMTQASPTQWRIPTQPSADGNTVETPVEQAAYADALMRYQAALRFIDGRMASLNLAIRGS